MVVITFVGHDALIIDYGHDNLQTGGRHYLIWWQTSPLVVAMTSPLVITMTSLLVVLHWSHYWWSRWSNHCSPGNHWSKCHYWQWPQINDDHDRTFGGCNKQWQFWWPQIWWTPSPLVVMTNGGLDDLALVIWDDQTIFAQDDLNFGGCDDHYWLWWPNNHWSW